MLPVRFVLPMSKACVTCKVCLSLFVDGYSDAHITFTWETSNGMDFVPSNLQMHPQYILTGMELSKSFTAYVAGKLFMQVINSV